MRRKKLLIRGTSLIFLIFILNYLAMQLHWYSSLWYFDMPMHFLGGFWLGLALLWTLSIKKISIRSFLILILTVLLVSIFWEIFEIFVNNYTIQDNFNLLDTLSDLSFDLAGAGLSIVYFFKRITIQTENTV